MQQWGPRLHRSHVLREQCALSAMSTSATKVARRAQAARMSTTGSQYLSRTVYSGAGRAEVRDTGPQSVGGIKGRCCQA